MKAIPLVSALLILSIVVHAQVNLDSALVAWYPFSGSAFDSSFNGHDGTVYGATLTAGKQFIPNSAYHFNGVNNYINVPDVPSLTPDSHLTMCALVRPLGFYSGNCQGNMILIKGDDVSSGSFQLIYGDNPNDGGSCNVYNPAIETFYGDISSNYFAAAAMHYSDYIISQKWYCVIATWDGHTMKMYVDGNLKFTVNGTVPIGRNTYPLTIGKMIFYPNQNLFPYWLNGDLDDVRIYKRVLTLAEISAYCRSFDWGETSVEEYNNNSFSVFPNPSTGSFTISLKESRSAEVKIMDATGRIILQEQIQNSKFEIRNLVSGVYFVQVQTGQGIAVQKIIIQ